MTLSKYLIEMTLDTLSLSRIKVLWDSHDNSELILAGIMSEEIAHALWEFGQPFTDLDGVRSADDLHSKFSAEYPSVSGDNPTDYMRLLEKYFEIRAAPIYGHISPGLLLICGRRSKEPVFDALIRDETLV